MTMRSGERTTLQSYRISECVIPSTWVQYGEGREFRYFPAPMNSRQLMDVVFVLGQF